MKQIKTITERLGDAESFDKMVNEALQDGWRLTKRKVLMPRAQGGERFTFIMLYAELEKEDIPERERHCANCKYHRVRIEKEPCNSCGSNFSLWEAAEG